MLNLSEKIFDDKLMKSGTKMRKKYVQIVKIIRRYVKKSEKSE